jgi:recombination protein RecA
MSVQDKSVHEKKNKSIGEAIRAIHKQFGSGSIMRLDGSEVAAVEVIPTGSVALDVALGCGGLPRGRIIEIYGPESSGKTTLTLHAIAEAQRSGGVCAFIDAEHALDTDYARRLGVDLEDLLVSQPDCGEQALEITDTLVRTGAIDLIVVDSVAALTPRAEIEGEMGDTHMGLQARLMSQALRKLTAQISRTKTIVIFINQLRQKIGVVYGNPETTTGGNALKFYCSIRLDIRRKKPIKRGEETIGSECKVKVVKNKLAPPFREADFEILYGVGVNKLGELVDTAEKLGVMEKSGTWYSYEGTKIGQGRDKVLAHLDEHPAIQQQLRDALIKQGPARRDDPRPDPLPGSRVMSSDRHRPLLTPVQAETLLDQVVYEQVVECIDLEALCRVEQTLTLMVSEIDGVAGEQVCDLAKAMLDRALRRLPDDLRRYLRAAGWPPSGGCELCKEAAPPGNPAPSGQSPTRLKS